MAHNDFYMSQKQIWLADEVLRVMGTGEIELAKAPSAVRKMKKADLAAILVRWDAKKPSEGDSRHSQLTQQNVARFSPDAIDDMYERRPVLESVVDEAHQMMPLTMQDFKAFKAARNGTPRRNLKKARCGCGQFKDQLENGTMQRHTKPAEQTSTGWHRVRCEWSGLFPPAVEEMRLDTNRRDAQNQVATGIRLTEVMHTYKHFQVPDTSGPKTFKDSGSRRGRRVATKNKHRANYGKRFQVRAA